MKHVNKIIFCITVFVTTKFAMTNEAVITVQDRAYTSLIWFAS